MDDGDFAHTETTITVIVYRMVDMRAVTIIMIYRLARFLKRLRGCTYKRSAVKIRKLHNNHMKNNSTLILYMYIHKSALQKLIYCNRNELILLF